jgi:hypothetical protein
MVSILLNNDMIKNYNIYGDENKDIYNVDVFFTTNEEVLKGYYSSFKSIKNGDDYFE